MMAAALALASRGLRGLFGRGAMRFFVTHGEGLRGARPTKKNADLKVVPPDMSVATPPVSAQSGLTLHNVAFSNTMNKV